MMYKIVRVAGCVVHVMMDELTYEDALEWCEYFGWEWSEEPGAFVWDLEIREM